MSELLATINGLDVLWATLSWAITWAVCHRRVGRLNTAYTHAVARVVERVARDREAPAGERTQHSVRVPSHEAFDIANGRRR